MESDFSTTAESNNGLPSPVQQPTIPFAYQRLISPSPIPDPLPEQPKRHENNWMDQDWRQTTTQGFKPINKQLGGFATGSYGEPLLVNSSPGQPSIPQAIPRTQNFRASTGGIGDFERQHRNDTASHPPSARSHELTPKRKRGRPSKMSLSSASNTVNGKARKKRTFATYAESHAQESPVVKLQRMEKERIGLAREVVSVLDKRTLEGLLVTAALKDPSLMAEVMISHERVLEQFVAGQDADDESEDGMEQKPFKLQKQHKSQEQPKSKAPNIPSQPTGGRGMASSDPLRPLSNNHPGYHYKHFEARPSPPGVDDIEWDRIYVCANSRIYTRCANNIASTKKARQSGETYQVALEVLEERRAAFPDNKLLGQSNGATAANRASRASIGYVPQPEASSRKQSVGSPFQQPKPDRSTMRAETTKESFTFPEAYPPPNGIGNDDWDAAYVEVNSRILAQYGAPKARLYRSEGETYRLALESQGLTKDDRPRPQQVPPPPPASNRASGSNPRASSSNARAPSRSFPPIEPDRPADVSSEDWKRIFGKANARIYYNQAGKYGDFRKSAEEAGKLRDRGETLKLALQIVQEERELANKPGGFTPRTRKEESPPRASTNESIIVDDGPSPQDVPSSTQAPKSQEPNIRPTSNGPIPVGLLRGYPNVVTAGYDKRMYWTWKICSFNREGYKIGMPDEMPVGTRREFVDLFDEFAAYSEEKLREEVLRRQVAGEK